MSQRKKSYSTFRILSDSWRVEERKSLHAATHSASTTRSVDSRVGSGITKQHKILAGSFPQISYNFIVIMLERAAYHEGLKWVE